MYGKFKYTDVQIAKKYTSKKLNQKYIGDYPNIEIGYYHPSSANWSYQFYVINTGKKLIKVVTTFGHILAEGDF